MSLNKVMLIGRLGRDVELRYANNGNAVGNFSVATSEQWKDKEGNKQERTEWHNIVAWGKLAENCSAYIRKGSQVYVEGNIRTRSYDDKVGTKRYVTEIVAQQVKFLDPSGKKTEANKDLDEDSSRGAQAGDDDIPF